LGFDFIKEWKILCLPVYLFHYFTSRLTQKNPTKTKQQQQKIQPKKHTREKQDHGGKQRDFSAYSAPEVTLDMLCPGLGLEDKRDENKPKKGR